MYWFSRAMVNTFNFSGRAQRKEYWYFVLSCFVLGFVLGFVQGFIFALSGHEPGERAPMTLTFLLMLVTFLPSMSLNVRRLHDIDRSGWWMLILLIPFVGPIVWLFWVTKAGTDGPNRFGDDPRAPNTARLLQDVSHAAMGQPVRFGKRD